MIKSEMYEIVHKKYKSNNIPSCIKNILDKL